MWNKIKKWFKYSETIFLARLTAFSGFVVAVLSGVDWSALLSLDFSQPIPSKQFLILGLGMLMQGIVLEMARRRNAKDL